MNRFTTNRFGSNAGGLTAGAVLDLINSNVPPIIENYFSDYWNVDTLPPTPEVGAVYTLTTQDGAYDPGMYVYNTSGQWILINTL